MRHTTPFATYDMHFPEIVKKTRDTELGVTLYAAMLYKENRVFLGAKYGAQWFSFNVFRQSKHLNIV